MLMKSSLVLAQQRSLANELRYFAGVFNKRKPLRKDLDHYDVIIIGCNMGGILSRHFDKVVHGKYKTMVVLDENINQIQPLRQIYEQQKLAKTDYLLNAKLALNMYTAHSENIGCKAIHPEQNEIVLRNGRTIGYDHLVIAMGLKHDYEAIKGFEDAWKDGMHPVFTNLDHPTWRSSQHKYTRWHYNFNHGQAYFCIPQYPFAGEVENYNFLLFQRISEWQLSHGRQSPLRNFTVINANDRFVQHNDSGDNFFKEELKKRNVRVEYGLKLSEIHQQTQQATFENVRTGAKEQRPYNHLYQIMPSKPHEPLVNAGLTVENGLLDVDIKTLRHRKYKNIFGLGDVCNLPTTKSTWAGFHQVSVVRTNLERSLQGQSLIAEYDGYTKVLLSAIQQLLNQIPFLLGQNTLTYLCHKYNNVNAWHNLYFSNGGFLASIRYYNWVRNFKKAFMDFYLEKNWGPPFYRMKKSYSDPKGEGKSAEVMAKFVPGKKSAH